MSSFHTRLIKRKRQLVLYSLLEILFSLLDTHKNCHKFWTETESICLRLVDTQLYTNLLFYVIVCYDVIVRSLLFNYYFNFRTTLKKDQYLILAIIILMVLPYTNAVMDLVDSMFV